jgi:hypothetical protein
MTTLKDAQRAVQQTLGTKQNSIEWQLAMTGDGHGLVDAGNGMIYVRTGENSSVIQVINGGIALYDGVICRIIKPPEDPLHWYAIRATDQRIDENGASGGSAALNMPPHHILHEYLGVDQVNFDFRQLTTLRVYAAGALTVGVLSGLLPRPGADLVVPTQTIDLASHVPASGALYCLISVDSAGAIVGTDGVATTGVFSLTLGDIPDTPAGNFRLAAVRLYTGQTVISESTSKNDIRDLRWPQERLASETPGATTALTVYYLSSEYWVTNNLLDPVHTAHTEVGLSRTGDNVSSSILVNTWDTKWNYPGLSVFPSGEWICTAEAASNASIQFYFAAYRVDGGGTETLLLTSDLSEVVTTRQAITMRKVSTSLATVTTDRLRIKIYIYQVGSIPNTTTATLYYDGTVDSHLTIPGNQPSILLVYDSILAGNSSGVAAAVSVAEQTLVGRITGGHVDDLSVAQVRALIGSVQAVAIKSSTYLLTAADQVVVFTATSTANLPAATGAGQTYRIVCRAGTLTIDANGSETIKGNLTVTLNPGDDLIITDTAAGVWE